MAEYNLTQMQVFILLSEFKGLLRFAKDDAVRAQITCTG
jgi:hypothetical protein